MGHKKVCGPQKGQQDSRTETHPTVRHERKETGLINGRTYILEWFQSWQQYKSKWLHTCVKKNEQPLHHMENSTMAWLATSSEDNIMEQSTSTTNINHFCTSLGSTTAQILSFPSTTFSVWYSHLVSSLLSAAGISSCLVVWLPTPSALMIYFPVVQIWKSCDFISFCHIIINLTIWHITGVEQSPVMWQPSDITSHCKSCHICWNNAIP